MKTNILKAVVASLVLTFAAAGTASAQEVPPQVQKDIRKVEKAEKGKAKAKARKNAAEEAEEEEADGDAGVAEKADKPNKGKANKGKANKGKGQAKAEKGDKDARADKAKKEKEKEAKPPKENDDDVEVAEAEAEAGGGSAAKAGRLEKEERKHLKRLAKIQRIADLGAEKGNGNLVSKAQMLRQKESLRHDRALKKINEAKAPKAVEAPAEGAN